MPNDFVEVFQPHLSTDETLLWSGQPRQGIFLRGSDALLIPFSLIWGGFALVWEGTVLFQFFFGSKSASPPGLMAFIFPLFGLPFVFVGLYLIFGRFFVDSWMRRRTWYGVTNQRVLIKSGLFSSNLKSLNLRSQSDISLTEKNDGTGTITFGNLPFFWMANSSWPGMNRHVIPTLDNIAGAKSVYDLISRASRN